MLKRGEICLGGIKGKCGLNHHAPMKYCDFIARGEVCNGGKASKCGFHHISETFIKCINGIRNGKKCDKEDCKYRHPGDKLPEREPTSTSISEKKSKPSSHRTVTDKNTPPNRNESDSDLSTAEPRTSYLECPFILNGKPCIGKGKGMCRQNHPSKTLS